MIFEPLKDKALFAEFSLDKELETIVWRNGADFAPEFLYQIGYCFQRKPERTRATRSRRRFTEKPGVFISRGLEK